MFCWLFWFLGEIYLLIWPIAFYFRGLKINLKFKVSLVNLIYFLKTYFIVEKLMHCLFATSSKPICRSQWFKLLDASTVNVIAL